MSLSKEPSLALIMVVFHEEDVIERCLQSIPDFITERLVIHDGPCHDATLALAQKYGCKTLEREHVGIAEPHRAWAYGQVKSSWILQLDADEFLSPPLQEHLKELISQPSVAAYSFVWPYWDSRRYVTQGWPRKKSLFCKEKITFLGFPQEEVRAKKGEIKNIDFVLEHRPHYENFTWDRFFYKGIPWIKVHAQYYLFPPQSLVSYPAQTTLSPNYPGIGTQPLLYIWILPFLHALGILINGGWKNGIAGWKISFFAGLYYGSVCWYVFLFSHHRYSHPKPGKIAD